MDFDTPSQTQLANPPPQNGEAAAASSSSPSAAADVAKNLEPDTCRICRSEGTPSEPLFYPCKCSGSIKYVHQDCLMEWLSHSQKKHCELCKTSFRFTKLYSPTMPKQLPFFVFIHHLAKYFLRNILVWLRVLLVAFVWLALLPALTRWEWSFFFWVSEEGLVPTPPLKALAEAGFNASAAKAAASAASASLTVASSYPHPPASMVGPSGVDSLLGLVANANNESTTASTAPAGVYGSVLDSNQTSLFSVLFNLVWASVGTPEIASMLSADNDTAGAVNTGPPTLLSDVAFFRNMTRWGWFNRSFIFALEGQFITFLVIICFILIILVRDYVLQQQPEINMRAAFNAGGDEDMGGVDELAAGIPGVPNDAGQAPGPRPPRGPRGQHRHHHHRHHHGHDHHAHDHDDDHEHHGPDGAGYEPGGSNSEWETDSDVDVEVEIDAAELLRPHVQGPARNGLQFGPIFDDDYARGPPVPDTPANREESESSSSSSSSADTDTNEATVASSSANNNNNNNKNYNRTAALPNFDRNFPLPSEGGATVQEYMNIYRRADGDQRRILEIAREENLEEHLQYWLRVMQNVAERRQSDRGSTASTISTAAADEDDQSNPRRPSDAPPRLWNELIQMPDTATTEMARSSSKGKQRADLPSPTNNNNGEASSSTPITEFEYGLRPRANTDGPSGPPRVNPLANNNWSFGPVPPTQTFTPEFIQPLYGDSAERLDGVPVLGDAPPYQGVTEPREGDLRLDGEQRRRSISSDGGMTRIAEETAAAGSSSTDTSGIVPTPPSTGSSHRNENETAAIPQTGNWADLVRIPMEDEANWADNAEGDATDFEDLPPVNTNVNNNNGDGDGEVDENEIVAPHGRPTRGAGPRRIPSPPPVPPADAAAAAAAAAANREAPAPPDSLLGEVANFMWRDLDDIDPADLPPILPDVEDEDHLEILNDDDDEAAVPLDEQDREAFEAAAAAAAAANMEAEAIEDAEDLEGVMELLGMRGPIAGLFQNVIFCGFLVTVSLLVGIFMPYNVGRLSIWLVANPMRPIMMLFSLAKLLQDMAALALGSAAYFTLRVLEIIGYGAQHSAQLLFGNARPYSEYIAPSLATTWDLCATSAARVIDNFNIDPPFLSTGEIRNFSSISHEALICIKANIGAVATGVGRAIVMITTGQFLSHGTEALEFVKSGGSAAWELVKSLPAVLSNPGSWVITLDSMDPVQVNPALAYWGGVDRSLAILFGYATMCLIAGLYLHRGSPFSSGATVQEWEASLIDGLNQASGVLKVILIIGIEMLVFPLYCGLLLDVALLPLFEKTTLVSRLQFSMDYPLTSIFVHWFVGTGYMFHFALFVSMCRKIMRKGVLYFIRDPDDPEFHPVRDVLERSVTTQLRKILFSAFVYGALVIICLGGVVWGLAYAGPEILPIHYSSNEPVLEFPIDLLFYNFLMPLAIKFFKPSDGLHSMYTWWFRKSARGLRITWFLFGERRIDEEGALALAPDSEDQQNRLWLTKQFLEYDEVSNKVVPMSTMSAQQAAGIYEDIDLNSNAIPARSPRDNKLIRRRKPDDVSMLYFGINKRSLIESGQLVPNGKFVRAPASDQVKIPKNKDVFLEVTDEATLRRELGHPPKKIVIHGPDSTTIEAVAAAALAATEKREQNRPKDIYHGKQYELVYIPPYFRVRIFLFIASIWMFAAVTGVSFTIIPLLFGRRLFRLLLPDDVRTNDIYAFSIGIYVLGSASYFVFHARSILANAWAAVKRRLSAASIRSAALKTLHFVQRVAKLAYAYFFILIVFPLLATAFVELYLLIPLHTYMYPPGSFRMPTGVSSSNGSSAESHHNIRIIQSWTLGLLYLKVSARTITSWYPEARLTSAIRAVLRRGNLDPDVRLLTRAFVVPGLVLGLAALFMPKVLADGFVAAATSLEIKDVVAPRLLQFFLPKTVPAPTVADMRLVYRLSYPFVALFGLGIWSLWGMVGVYASWKLRIRDEAYLIGERLHNFGVTSVPQPGGRRGAVRRV